MRSVVLGRPFLCEMVLVRQKKNIMAYPLSSESGECEALLCVLSGIGLESSSRATRRGGSIVYSCTAGRKFAVNSL